MSMCKFSHFSSNLKLTSYVFIPDNSYYGGGGKGGGGGFLQGGSPFSQSGSPGGAQVHVTVQRLCQPLTERFASRKVRLRCH